MVSTATRSGLRRLLAFSLDWLLIAAWGGLLFAAVLFFSQGEPKGFAGPWTSQGVAFLAMTLPVTLYFAFLEGSKLQASIGKRVLGLRVTGSTGGRLGLGRSFLRSGFKFVPWELGHLVAQQAVFAGEAGLASWVYLPMALSFALPIWWSISLVTRGRTPYDVWAGAKVVRADGSGDR